MRKDSKEVGKMEEDKPQINKGEVYDCVDQQVKYTVKEMLNGMLGMRRWISSTKLRAISEVPGVRVQEL